MKHARDDYNDRIVDIANEIPDDEPVFLFRGQDKYAAQVVEYWAELMAGERELIEHEIRESRNVGFEPEFIEGLKERVNDLFSLESMARVQASEMRMWPTKKTPDLKYQSMDD